jgi:Sporulation and spore germination/Immunoglobulin-like domain of bacterial spore germination
MKYAIASLGVIVAALLGLTVASCGTGSGAESAGTVPPIAAGGTDGSESAPATETETASPTDTGTDTVAPTEFVNLEVWYTSGETIYMMPFRAPKTPRIGAAALQALLSDPEVEGVGSAIPRDTTFLGLRIEDGVAYADLSSEFESGGGSLSQRLRVAQVVYTLTQFPTVKGVRFLLDGRPVDVIGGEGVIVDHPVTRREYRDLLPAILVRGPGFGDSVSNPVKVFGSANVFEANVTVEVLDAAGHVVGSTFTTATCGTGCRGTFSVEVAYDVPASMHGTIVVHDDDAAGTGSPPHEVRIPVVLNPSS